MSTHSNIPTTYSIRDASKLTGLPTSTLRYYESIGIVEPVERGGTSKHRVYSQANIDVLDTIACLNATGMKLDAMKTYIANLSADTVDAYEQVALLKAQQERLNEAAKHIQIQQEYVQLKVEYWKAYERGDKDAVDEITKKAKQLSNNLKKV